MKRLLRWIGISLGGVVALALVAGGVLYVMGGRRLSAKVDVVAEQELVIPNDSASIGRGAHLVGSRPCGMCHGADLGGNVFTELPLVVVLAGPNLTSGRGGRNAPRTDVEWERAIRHGIRREGTALLVMPSEIFHAIADDDMAPMIAYLKQLPPVDREVQPTTLRILGRVLFGAGQVPTSAQLSPRTAHAWSADTTTATEYGRYLVASSGCHQCHGNSLSGGADSGPNDTPVSNITPTGIGHYTEADFIHALRTGERPGGGAALSKDMPWKYYGTMTDGELKSMWLYLKTVPSKKFGEP